MRQRYASLLLTTPAALVYLGLFVASVIYFFIISFWQVKFYRIVPDFTIKNYLTTVTTHIDSAGRTLLIAFCIASVCTVVGFVYAWIIRFKAGRFAPLLLFIALIALFGGYLMKIYSWKTMLGSDGAVNSALMYLGLVKFPIQSLFYSPVAVVISLTHFLLPFAILPIVAALRGITDAEIDSARDLGASGFRILCDVLLPRASAGIFAGFSLTFLISVGDYLTPQMVGGTMSMYGQLIAPQFGNFNNWPLGAAMSFTLLFLSGLVLFSVSLLLSRLGPRG